MRRLTLVTALICASAAAHAHELRPAYLEMRETARNEFSVIWKVPARGELRFALNIRLPATCKSLVDPLGTFQSNAYIERSRVQCANGLKGEEIAVDGLRSSLTDALARLEYIDGASETVRLTPDRASFIAKGPETALDLASTYMMLGIDHILTGLDHLLFVFALILLIRDRWMLVKTITAFTVAHSVTLAGSALGYLSLPQKPVEAVIALSIAFVAVEVVKAARGPEGRSRIAPWIIAFAFGLLHGFGFAGALKEIGLPENDVPLALLLFNLGVEAGQLMFVAGVLVLLAALRLVTSAESPRMALAAGYAIGAISTSWLVFRLASF